MPDATVVIRIAEGTFAIDEAQARAAIDVSRLVTFQRVRRLDEPRGNDVERSPVLRLER